MLFAKSRRRPREPALTTSVWVPFASSRTSHIPQVPAASFAFALALLQNHQDRPGFVKNRFEYDYRRYPENTEYDYIG